MEQRRTRRFKLQLPLAVTRSGAERITVAGKTNNISSNGVLFTAENGPDLTGGSIEYLIQLNQDGPRPVQLRCIGKIVRLQRPQNGMSESSGTQVAATLERYEFVRED